MSDTAERVAGLKMSAENRQKLKVYLGLRFERSEKTYPTSVYALKQCLGKELDLYTTQEEYRDIMLELGFEQDKVEYGYYICGGKIKNNGFYFRVKDSELWKLREHAHYMIDRHWRRSGMARRSVVKFLTFAKGTIWENDSVVAEWVGGRERLTQMKEDFKNAKKTSSD
jgi:hypothetical protein